MNEKFYNLPEEKQQKIINAGYRVFSQNSYKKSPVSEIAAEAGISKSLLFHYFQNKKELYLFLWDTCGKVTIEYLEKYGCYEPGDLFEMMFRGLKAKMEIMRRYPNLGAFVIKAFYEKDPEISQLIQERYRKLLAYRADAMLTQLDPSDFVEGLDLSMMYKEMYLASEGYLWEKVQQGDVDCDAMEQDFTRMIEFWKSIFLRKEKREKEEM
ncbi:MAG: TetR/AcrR family transcriptional regulator [Anaerovoracaceae bacterium]